jgi:hypothetical protein
LFVREEGRGVTLSTEDNDLGLEGGAHGGVEVEAGPRESWICMIQLASHGDQQQKSGKDVVLKVRGNTR